MKIIKNKCFLVRVATLVLLLFSCFYMYDFYKSLSGFIANGFREPLVMLPMIIAFFLPVLCFLFFFYDFYVRAINPTVKAIYSIFVILYAAVDLVLIFSKMSLYVSNNAFGVYQALPSIILHFPYDMIVILLALIALQIFNILSVDRKNTSANEFMGGLKQRGTVHVSIPEYILLSIFAIVIFVFSGAAIYATFSAFRNALYDARYIFLLLWVMLIPMGNLLIVTLKPEKMNLRERTKQRILASGIAVNVVFGLLFLAFELTSPDFLIHIGKPLFLITFSISLPIEPCIIFGIMALGVIVMAVRLVILMTGKKRASGSR